MKKPKVDHPDSPMMTPAEVAAYLRISQTKVYLLIKDGTIPGKRIGRQWRCNRKAIEDWAAK